MQSEQEWLNRADANDESGAAERYQYFMRPEKFEDLGPIETINDEYLGDGAKIRTMRVGMVRNSADDNKKEVTVYLQPFPHIRITKAKELQGWYKALHEPPGTRPRPCFTEAVLTEPYGGYCAVGCIFSLPADEPISTPLGSRSIQAIRTGDIVWGRSLTGKVAARVLGVSTHIKPEGLIRLVLADGRRLKMTGDHPVYSADRGWVAAETLSPGEKLENEELHAVWKTDSQRQVLPSVLAKSKSETAEASQEVPRLRKADQKLSSGLRWLSFESTLGQRKSRQGGISEQGDTQVGRDEAEDERVCPQESGEYGSTGERSEVSRVQVGESRRRSQRNFGVQNLEAASLQGSEGTNVPYAFSLGGSSSEVDGLLRPRLGLRAIRGSFTGWLGLLTRFLGSVIGDRRGKGVSNRGGGREDTAGPKPRIQDNRSWKEGARADGSAYVIRVERIPGAVRVFDIETETGNFYQRGILVHNCYINSGTRGYRGTGLISVPLNYGEQIGKQLSKMRRAAAGYFSSFTDPFTPLEDYYHNTQRAAEEFVKVDLPIFFLSRLRYPEWAVDLLRKNKYSYAQKSINTSDPEDWRYLSPGALSLEDHFADIERLKRAGIYVSIQCNPIIAGVTSHEDILKLFTRLRDVGADHVIVKFVEAGFSWAPAMVERMIKRFGARGEAFAALFTDNIGGQRTIEEGYRLKAHKLYSAQARRLGLGYATCYEYKYERDSLGNILNKTGVSIGREFTTSSQCHGQRVPVFTRDTETELFREVEECPPSGCLYCASENDGKARCGDELAGQANAVRFVDLKIPIGQGKARDLVQITGKPV